MSAQDDPQDEVVFLAPDFSLRQKIGTSDLDKILSVEVIQKAEKIIADSSDAFYGECVEDIGKLTAIAARLQAGSRNAALFNDLISVAFAVKVKAGQAGFSLVAALAKSLHTICENSTADKMPALPIIVWHVGSISEIMRRRIMGLGGDAGKAILAEIEKLAAK